MAHRKVSLLFEGLFDKSVLTSLSQWNMQFRYCVITSFTTNCLISILARPILTVAHNAHALYSNDAELKLALVLCLCSHVLPIFSKHRVNFKPYAIPSLAASTYKLEIHSTHFQWWKINEENECESGLRSQSCTSILHGWINFSQIASGNLLMRNFQRTYSVQNGNTSGHWTKML